MYNIFTKNPIWQDTSFLFAFYNKITFLPMRNNKQQSDR